MTKKSLYYDLKNSASLQFLIILEKAYIDN